MPRPVFACLSARSMQAMSPQRGSFAERLARFAAANRGAVSMLFGLMCVVLFLAVGGAVDFGRWLHARTQTAAALETAKRFYRESTRTRLDLLEDTIDLVVVEDGNAVTANGAAYIETRFLKLAGIPELQLLKLSGAEFSKAVLASGGNAQYNLE